MSRYKLPVIAFLCVLFNLCAPASAWAASVIQVDGSFADWNDQISLSDGFGDGPDGGDFKTLAWGTNLNEQELYFMIERFTPKSGLTPMVYRLFFDMNNNGSYEDKIDKFAELQYNPSSSEGDKVSLKIFSSSGKLLYEKNGVCGDGGLKFEFALTVDELQIIPPQPIRFYLSGIGGAGDRLPGRGDVMWVPFPGKGGNKIWIVAGIIVWLVITAFFLKHRIWLFYFIWGAVGFSILLIMTLRGSPVEFFMEHLSGLILQSILRLLNIITLVYNDSPGTLLVLSRVDNTWTTMGVDIETSGLLEMCIFLGLIFFYPGYTTKMRTGYSLLGVILIYFINIVRMLTVIFIVQLGGRDYLFFAHSVLGRLVYFVLTIALYWAFFTKPTLKMIWEQVQNA
ncbi:MAG: hypothetical protein APF81_26960 [Desulfosporosinus sp. BRH_c37]|nr:MAG: hypothetical protein APF81_26960 [Desulfosporosinus sp. BRH_c37]